MAVERIVRHAQRDDAGEQLALPFLTADQVAALDAAHAAIQRSHGRALADRRWSEADELERIGNELLDLLDEHAQRVRVERKRAR